MAQVSRRRFLQAAAASTAFPLFTISGTKASGRVLGANDRIRVGITGAGGRGTEHINQFTEQQNVEIAYLIDPDTNVYKDRLKQVNDRAGYEPKCIQDIRDALNDKNLDAISVATCNHWHSLLTIWACQAGKDVYVEKPISHNVFEGRQCVKAADRYKRIVQHGTQQRSDLSRAKQIAALQSGKYGKLLVSKGYCCKPRWSIGFKQPGPPPVGFDFNIWLGPAPLQPFHANLHPYNWHWFWDMGNGDIGNQGVHEMDVARWAIKDATLPTKIWSLGGRFFPDGPDQGQTPNMELSVMEFGDVLLVFEVRGLVANKDVPTSPPFKVANEYYTTEGVIREDKFYPNGGGEPQTLEGGDEATVAPGGPFGCFINACRTRNTQDVNAPAEVAHYSAALCHLANISYRLGDPAKYDAVTKSIGDNKQVVEAFEALHDNLRAVNVKLDSVTYKLGRTLTFDPQSEKFVGDDEANAMLTRQYREPFVVPAEV